MDLQYFDVLEEKIGKIVGQVENLKTENRELRLRIQELQAVLEEKERVIFTLKTEVDKSREVKSEIETYKKNQDRIRTKVETLLEKLKEFEAV
jgi:chromosome segregation ATPase